MTPPDLERDGTERAGSRSTNPLVVWVDQLRHDERLDRLVELLRGPAAALADGSSGPALRGEQLGHPVHPLLTDVVIGCLTSASILDVIGGRRARPAAQRLIALGVVSALPTVASGLADWEGIDEDEDRRVGAAHALANTIALGTYAWSWSARRRGRHGRGVLAALAGMGVASTAGYLGGHLAFGTKDPTEDRARDTTRPRDDAVIDLTETPDAIEAPELHGA